MTSVQVITEDKTGGGLERTIRAAVQEARRSRGRSALEFQRSYTCNGGADLLKRCAMYRLLRNQRKPRVDHVVFVIDAKGSWDLPAVFSPEERRRGGPPWSERLPEVIQRCETAMRAAATRDATADEFQRLEDGFHPHVLVWERESLILPVLAELQLDESIADPYKVQDAKGLVAERTVRARLHGYSKGLTGAMLLGQIASRLDLVEKVLASNESLRKIVEMLATV